MLFVAVSHAVDVLKAGGHFCSFSPCVEQVSRTVKIMMDLGFEGVPTDCKFSICVHALKGLACRASPSRARFGSTHAIWGELNVRAAGRFS